MIDYNCASFYFLRERMDKVFERKILLLYNKKIGSQN